MSYQVLARKWRPQVFEDVAGQEHITRTLQNAITSGRLAHAFLFSGPRGVGKTTTARILAKALNCSEGPTPTPCGKCNSCIETAAGTAVDVIEIDGASNRGIEHIRELREAVKYAPVGGKHKVYVIDEVHMLTNEAFNALLKTLEEPPPRVIFIFATTEPQKIPATIHSRCQRYGFKRVALNEIIGRLRKIADAEGITISDTGLAMIARAAEGSMRDSQSLLDQAISYSGMQIKDEDLQATLGSVAQAALLQFAGGLLARDAAALLRQIDEMLERGQDVRQFLAGLVEHIRNLLVIKISRDPGRIVELPAADIDVLKQQAGNVESEQLLMLFDILSATLDELKWSPHQRYTFEIGVIKACSLAALEPIGGVLSRVQELETRLVSGGSRTTVSHQQTRERTASYAPAAAVSGRPAAVSVPPSPNGAADTSDEWSRVIAVVKSRKPVLATFLVHSAVLTQTQTDFVIGVPGSDFQVKKVSEPENCRLIEELALETLKRKVRISFQAAPTGVNPSESKPKKQTKTASPEPDPAVQDVLKVFTKGEVIDTDQSGS